MSGDLPVRPVVAAVDGSESARHACRWAAAEAHRRDLPLRLVHAVKTVHPPYTGGWMSGQNYIDDMVKFGQEVVAEAGEDVARDHLGLEVRTDVVVADPVVTLVAESETAAMVVLGSRGLGGFTGMLVGSTAVGLVGHGHCPVAVIRGATPDAGPPTDGPVVVGVDGSPANEAAVAAAFEEASMRGVDLVAVHTWTEYVADPAYAGPSPRDWTEPETRQHEMLGERLAGRQETHPDVVVRRMVVRDHPVSALLAQSADAQLLIVGSRGRGGFTGLLLGSTSQALIYHATCPLLVVRPTA